MIHATLKKYFRIFYLKLDDSGNLVIYHVHASRIRDGVWSPLESELHSPESESEPESQIFGIFTALVSKFEALILGRRITRDLMLSECFWNYLTVLCEASDDLLLRKAAAATLNECEISISFVSAYICIQNINSYQCPEYWGRLHFSQFTQ